MKQAANLNLGVKMKKADIERMKDALREVCYRPGEWPGFVQINYCRWCHYAEQHPHHPNCVMSLVGPTPRDASSVKE